MIIICDALQDLYVYPFSFYWVKENFESLFRVSTLAKNNIITKSNNAHNVYM